MWSSCKISPSPLWSASLLTCVSQCFVVFQTSSISQFLLFCMSLFPLVVRCHWEWNNTIKRWWKGPEYFPPNLVSAARSSQKASCLFSFWLADNPIREGGQASCDTVGSGTQKYGDRLAVSLSSSLYVSSRLLAWFASWMVANLHKRSDFTSDIYTAGKLGFSCAGYFGGLEREVKLKFDYRQINLTRTPPSWDLMRLSGLMKPLSKLPVFVNMWCLGMHFPHTDCRRALNRLVLRVGSSSQGFLLTVSGLDIARVGVFVYLF